MVKKNVVERNRQKDDKITWRMRIARWINNATHAQTHTHTHPKYETRCFSTAEIVIRTLFNITIIRTVLVLFITGSLYHTIDRRTDTRLLEFE